MRTLVWTVGIVALVLIVLGIVLKALKWLIILGVVALIVAVATGAVKLRR